jgi:hypothetical protein
LYIKTFFETHGKSRIEPIYLPTNSYAVESDNSYSESLKARFDQVFFILINRPKDILGQFLVYFQIIKEIAYLLHKLITTQKFYFHSIQQFWKTISLCYAVFVPHYMVNIFLIKG